MLINTEFTFTILDENKTLRGFCKNLSHTGIQFITDEKLSEGQFIEVILDTKSDKFKPMKAKIEVVRIELSHDNEYSVAGKILEFY